MDGVVAATASASNLSVFTDKHSQRSILHGCKIDLIFPYAVYPIRRRCPAR